MSFTKVVRLGTRELYVGKRASVFCKIEYKTEQGKDRLSISGVEGPRRDGNAHGSCGQIEMHLGDGSDITLAPGWTAESIAEFLHVWRAWHLNDVRAGCEHQRASWNPSEAIELVTYRLTSAALSAQNKIKRRTEDELARGAFCRLTPIDHALYTLPWERHDAPDADSTYSGMYEVHKRETKTAGWLRPEEHARGLLGKPCEVCSYKYGTAWLHEDVPTGVLEWLQALPDTDITPAWV